ERSGENSASARGRDQRHFTWRVDGWQLTARKTSRPSTGGSSSSFHECESRKDSRSIEDRFGVGSRSSSAQACSRCSFGSSISIERLPRSSKAAVGPYP